MPILSNSSKELIREANSSFTNGKYSDAVKYLEELLLLVPKTQAIYGQILANLAVARSYHCHHSRPDELLSELLDSLRLIPSGFVGIEREVNKVRPEHCCLLKNLATLHWYTTCWQDGGDESLCMISQLAERLDTLGSAHISSTFCELWSLLVQEQSLHYAQTVDQLAVLKKRLYPPKNDSTIHISRHKCAQEVNKLRFSLKTLHIQPTLAIPGSTGFSESSMASNNFPVPQVDVQQLETRLREFMNTFPVEQQIKGVDVLLLAQLAYMKCDYLKALQLMSDVPVENGVEVNHIGDAKSLSSSSSSASSSMFSLQPIFTKCEQSIRLLLLNNRLCCLTLTGKPHLASLFPLQEVLALASSILVEKMEHNSNGCDSKENNNLNNNESLCVARRHHVPHDVIYYNAGIALLLSNQPRLAFEYFVQVAQRYSQNPRLWLRLAQCCVRHHENARLINSEVTEMPVLDLRHHCTTQTRDVWQLIWWQGEYGNGTNLGATKSQQSQIAVRKDSLRNESNKSRQAQRRQENHQQQHKEDQSLQSEAACIPAPTLHFGAMCIIDGLACLPSQLQEVIAVTAWTAVSINNTASVDGVGGTVSAPPVNQSSSALEQKRRVLVNWLRECGDAIVIKTYPGHGMRAPDALSLAVNLLCEGAYIHLRLCQYHQCVTYARQIWQLLTSCDPHDAMYPNLLSFTFPRRSIRRQFQQLILLSQQYMSEALIALGSSAMAVGLLQNALVTLNEGKLTPATIPLFINLCVAFIHDNKLQQASQLLRTVTKELTDQRIPWPKELGKLYFYLDLRVSSGRHLCKWRLPGFS